MVFYEGKMVHFLLVSPLTNIFYVNSNLFNMKTFVTCFSSTTNVFQSSLKDAMPVSFRSELFTSYSLTTFKQRNLLP